MSEIAIKVENLYKKFCSSLKRSIYYGTYDMARTMLGISYKLDKLRKKEFWALENVSFELKKGETLGVIGVNGSGKTTLLRLLTGIFPPDNGRITVNGRLGSLIAIGAGFHPHMTGAENIYLNGTILGMTKKEIKKNYDSIVDFADIGDFLDAPINTYSSGMRVRLGFAIAIHCEPDILLIDEVLSVGDINFQKKSMSKLQELKNRVSTIFVSHSMRHVSRICDRVMLLNKGKIEEIGESVDIISKYINDSIDRNKNDDNNKVITKIDNINVSEFNIYSMNDLIVKEIELESDFKIKIKVDALEKFKDVLCSFTIFSVDGSVVTFINTENVFFDLDLGANLIECTVIESRILPGNYYVKAKIASRLGGLFLEIDSGSFCVKYKKGNYRPFLGFYFEKVKWQINNNS